MRGNKSSLLSGTAKRWRRRGRSLRIHPPELQDGQYGGQSLGWPSIGTLLPGQSGRTGTVGEAVADAATATAVVVARGAGTRRPPRCVRHSRGRAALTTAVSPGAAMLRLSGGSYGGASAPFL